MTDLTTRATDKPQVLVRRLTLTHAVLYSRARRATGRPRQTGIARHTGRICDHQPGLGLDQAQRGRASKRRVGLRNLGAHRRAIRERIAAFA